jgi:hypothetical protein
MGDLLGSLVWESQKRTILCHRGWVVTLALFDALWPYIRWSYTYLFLFTVSDALGLYGRWSYTCSDAPGLYTRWSYTCFALVSFNLGLTFSVNDFIPCSCSSSSIFIMIMLSYKCNILASCSFHILLSIF